MEVLLGLAVADEFDLGVGGVGVSPLAAAVRLDEFVFWGLAHFIIKSKQMLLLWLLSI